MSNNLHKTQSKNVSVKDHTGKMEAFCLQPEDSIRMLKQLCYQFIGQGGIPFEEIGIRFGEKQVLSNQLIKDFPTRPTFEMFVISTEIQRLKTENEKLREKQQINDIVTADFSQQVVQLSEDIKSQHDQFSQQQQLYQQQIYEQQEQLQQYDVAYQQAQATIQDQYNQLEQAKFSIQQYEEFVQGLNQNIQQLQDDLAQAQEEIALKKKSEEDLQKKLKAQVKKTQEAENEVSELQTQIIKQKGIMSGLQDELDKQKRKVKVLEGELEMAVNGQKVGTIMEGEVQKLKQENKNQKTQLMELIDLPEQVKKLQSEKQEITQKWNELQKLHNKDKGEFENTREELQNQIQLLNQNQKQLEQKLEKSNKDKDNLTKTFNDQKSKYEDSIKSLNQKIIQKDEDIQLIQKSLAQDKANATHAQELLLAKQESDKLKADQADLREKMKKLNQEQLNYKMQTDKQINDLSTLNQQLTLKQQSLEIQNDDLIKKIQQQEEQLDNFNIFKSNLIKFYSGLLPEKIIPKQFKIRSPIEFLSQKYPNAATLNEFSNDPTGSFNDEQFEVYAITREPEQMSKFLYQHQFCELHTLFKITSLKLMKLHKSVNVTSSDSDYYNVFLFKVIEGDARLLNKVFAIKELKSQPKAYPTLISAAIEALPVLISEHLLEDYQKLIQKKGIILEMRYPHQLAIKKAGSDEFYYAEEIVAGEFRQINGGGVVKQADDLTKWGDSFTLFSNKITDNKFMVSHLQVVDSGKTKTIYGSVLNSEYEQIHRFDFGRLGIQTVKDELVKPGETAQLGRFYVN